MYKKHGRDRETNLELQIKALVVKALEEQGLSMEPRILVTLLGELALAGSPPKVPSSQGSTAATTPSITYRNQLIAPWCFPVAGRTL